MRLTRGLPLSVCYDDGLKANPEASLPRMTIRNRKDFFSRLARDGSLGFGEAYIMGSWDSGCEAALSLSGSDELVDWLAAYSARVQELESEFVYFLRWLANSRLPVSKQNTEADASTNIAAHYDVDVRLFETFLDPSMTYSCAWFEEGDDLISAQQRKIDSILDLARVNEGMRVLDIGSGFGGLGFRAVQERSASVVGLTLSKSQLAWAIKRRDSLGLRKNLEFRLQDYRLHREAYDSVVSVEMLEAVGSEYWADYFAAVDNLLKPGGHFALQTVTFPHRRMRMSKRTFSWVDRYIFPGGCLPSLHEIQKIVASRTGLEIVEARRLTDSYSKTLREWRHRFVSELSVVRGLGFDERFCRLWVLYFAYFEAGFDTRYCDVWQLSLRKRHKS